MLEMYKVHIYITTFYFMQTDIQEGVVIWLNIFLWNCICPKVCEYYVYICRVGIILN